MKHNWLTIFLDALHCAKEAVALLPQLPPHIKPVYIRILNAIYKLNHYTGRPRISDISKESGLLLPNTTKVINEMVELNNLEKITPDFDKRVVLVRATELGEQYIQKYIASFIESLEKEVSKINEIECMIMIDTIYKVHQAIKVVYNEREPESEVIN
ncbi:MAG: MarR family winged helix-turn-helix transcriptional regulator [Syntrophomonas sp.]